MNINSCHRESKAKGEKLEALDENGIIWKQEKVAIKTMN